MIDYAVLGRKVLKTYPFLAKELITVPDLTDMSKIGLLYAEYCDIQGKAESKSKETHHRFIFIAVILKLYDPDSFEFKKNMKNGLRKKLSDTLQCKPTIISDSFKTVRNYIDIYPEFRNEVAYIYSELKMFSEKNKS